MPRVTIEFTLPDEQADYRDATNGSAWRELVEEIYNHYLALDKHGEGPAADAAGEVRERLNQEMNARGLDLWQ